MPCRSVFAPINISLLFVWHLRAALTPAAPEVTACARNLDMQDEDPEMMLLQVALDVNATASAKAAAGETGISSPWSAGPVKLIPVHVMSAPTIMQGIAAFGTVRRADKISQEPFIPAQLPDRNDSQLLWPAMASLPISVGLFLGIVVWLGVPGWHAKRDDVDVKHKIPLQWHHIVLLMQLDMLPPFSQDIHLASLPLMAEDLNTTESGISLTLQLAWTASAVAGMGLSVLSDVMGRRPILLLSMAVYSSGAMISANSPSVSWMIAGRMFQALGESCSFMCYAIGRDRSTNEAETADLFATFAAVTATSTVAAPLLGGLITTVLGWRMIFVLLSFSGLCIFFQVLLTLPETCPRASSMKSENAGALEDAEHKVAEQFPLTQLMNTMTSEAFAYMATLWVTFACLFAVLSDTSLLLNSSFGLNELQNTLVLLGYAVFNVLGAGTTKIAVRYMDSGQVLQCSSAMLFFVGLLFFANSAFGQQNLVTTLTCTTCFIYVMGTMHGVLRSKMLEPFSDCVATAMGFVNFVNFPVASVFCLFFVHASEAGGVPSFCAWLGCAIMVQQALWFLLRGSLASSSAVSA
eukprot:TRINITY_DN62632_c0_g1_i1.p1 TRINITY_DN62632_c0_g1~~TRINITY_DN62632_c0_g1_i1.p1  ORF type:complete len:579 (-),score=80.03 TRINITY_DN62632_c0_g1_i1:68-1804(-)